ncbi:transferase family-domain-containing protein [Aspergillus caelatus]|uniref:Transferase family-domain-containing protein n=1 Tax=Aspergillus caelatus TaxID=61420 RepID=A0A5N7ALD4_9EURO|nr:transferase family-domain-containing protein [Aspergillus caelatus]KAE8370724.1 transferase family-domain-containing protein [Aspergillus caelatus]
MESPVLQSGSLPSFKPYVLSPLDHALACFYLTATFTFSLQDSTEGISVLEAAVSQLVSKLPFLSGNLIWKTHPDNANVMGEIHPPIAATWNTYPMLRVKYHGGKYTPISYGRLNGPAQYSVVSYDNILREEFLPLPFETILGETSPVLRFQANVLEDGIILCASFHHNVIDGKGMNTIMEALAACCRNPTNVQQNELPTDPISEALCRNRLSAAASPTPDAFVVRRGKNCPIPAAPEQGLQAPITRLLVLSGAKVIQLKRMCDAIVQSKAHGEVQSSGVKQPTSALSSNDIISALMWLCVLRSRAASDPRFLKREKSSFSFPTDARIIFTDGLRSTYIGNSVISATIESPFLIEDAVHSSSATVSSPDEFNLTLIARLALVIRSGFRSVNRKYVEDVISSIATGDHAMVTASNADFALSSLRHMGFYGLNFGPVLGKITHADLPDPRMKNQAWVLPDRYPGPGGRSSWEIRMTLDPPVMKHLVEDKLFQWMRDTNLSKL